MTSGEPKPPAHWPPYSGLFRRVLLPLAVLLWVIPALPFLGFGAPIGSTEAGRAPTDPPGWAFSIWFGIFALYTVFAVYAWRQDETLSRQLSLFLAMAGILAAGWMLDAITGAPLERSALTIATLATSAFAGALFFDRMRGMGGSAMKLVADALTGLLAGWSSVALAVTVPELLRRWQGLGPTDAPWPMVGVSLAILAGLSAVFASFTSRSLWYFAALAWGVAALIIANWWTSDLTVIALAYGAGGAVILWRRLGHAAPGAHSGWQTRAPA